jgi:hypothetical protein
LHCANARFMPIDRWHRYAARHWEQAVRIKPDMIGLRRKMEAMLREEFAGHHERGLSSHAPRGELLSLLNCLAYRELLTPVLHKERPAKKLPSYRKSSRAG